MQSLQNWLGGSAPDKEPPKASVLSEWKTYQSGGGASGSGGGGAAGQSDALLASAEEGGAGAAATAKSLLSSAAALVTSAATSAATAASGATSNIPNTTQWTYFVFFLGMGALFLAMAFFLFLPVIILAPAKFAMTFSIGSALLIASLGALKGWKAMFGHLLEKERLPFAGAYFGSLLATLYVSLVMHSYLFSLVFCGTQLITLVYYVASYFPGGAAGAQSVVGFAGRGALSVGGASLRAVFGK
ncbi:transport SFT2-like [Micractinium conductrix]|uniref:Vesicle transport protein n=1 Tax=Micractinium conductrix TaxID=554055 RepID=A0A2P6VFN5_9CHLO|nr:transport SFT2-like [Micractinium conductrix]|eukprot:PSC72906.1 transport SFT2-like [Micractinium conductrix]